MSSLADQKIADETMKTLLFRYHEIAIKGDNRRFFEERLAINARKILKRVHNSGDDSGLETQSPLEIKTRRLHGRILVDTPYNEASEQALSKNLFGLSSFSPVVKVPTDLKEITDRCVSEFKRHVAKQGLPKSFRVSTRRSDKVIDLVSTKIDAHIGAAILREYPTLPVQMKGADFTLGVEIRNETSFLWVEKIPGPGGLPVGSNGPVLTLLSGGLDSPVAAIQTLKRGSSSHFIHFYGTPFVGAEVLEKIKDLAKIVNLYQPNPRPLNVIPFGKIQEQIALVTSPKMRTLLYRRMMIRISCAVAKRVGALALVTGESLGQVASQTLENLSLINQVSELPILRPLITYDKDEIIKAAQRFGSYETSIRPAIDCCTLFADRHPCLKGQLDPILEEEAKFNVQELVESALSGIEIVRK